MNFRNLMLAGAFILAVPLANASVRPLKIETGSAEFLAVGKPSALKIAGKGGKVSGGLQFDSGKISGELVVGLDDFDTGIKLRNQHMKETYLETAKFPSAKLKLEPVEIPGAASSGEFKALPFKGELELHGVKQPVAGTVDISLADTALKARAEFALKITDYKIDIPSYAGIKVADVVTINAVVEGTLAAAAVTVPEKPVVKTQKKN